MTILVTGAAGFVGYHVSERLMRDGFDVVGLDNFNDYYDVQLKRDRFGKLLGNDRFVGVEGDVAEFETLNRLFQNYGITSVIHLAAQAGVRYSITNPFAYLESNLTGFGNVLEACRRFEIRHLLYASSSSVYGANVTMPFSVHDSVDHPVSLYAATKKANELMAHTYSHLYGLPTTGLRFFTVYGPWGRPDMAYFSFTRDIENGVPIKVFNEGRMQRDFTYVDDIVEGVVRLHGRPPQPDPAWDRERPDPGSSYAPYRVYNIGNNKPVALMQFIRTIEQKLGIEAKLQFMPMQPGDVEATFANIDTLQREIGFKPVTALEDGIGNFVDWYRDYYASRKVISLH
ncbi:NAD-dependent epimerase [Paenibacillus rhizovicinus]|uniref:NAD-dependent epimerase n=1 Tax=Paenibacillus rhizovicinus TaxID=2704463 RepID=A0A6C0P718_9BACL|nr:NAD-dependent epimerase [Paenibacillus rhizovicinus]QHW34318.1 NAD-dependent epimerase [Paenibacillus rhizovicinus]